MISFLSLRVWKSKRFPLISLTWKSKNPLTRGALSCYCPDLKISLANNPPINKINNTLHIFTEQIVKLETKLSKIGRFLGLPAKLFKYYQLFYRILTIIMESSDGFRRRAAIVATENKILTSPELQSFISGEDNLGRDKVIKFRKINTNNHAILNNRKKEEEFKKTIKEIGNRKCTFYRMGFKSYEKHGQNKLFGQVLGMNSAQMKGTMYVGQLWANHEVGKFLKQNKIYMTKLKLMDRLQTIKKQIDEVDKNERQSDIGLSSCHSIGTLRNLLVQNSIQTETGLSFKKTQYNKTLQGIYDDLKNLKVNTGRENLQNEMKYLEKCRQKMQRVQRKYFVRMLDIQ